MTIRVGLDPLDVVCTIVLLKAKHSAGAMHLPLSVQLLPEELRDIGWQKVAEEYLAKRLEQKRNQERPTFSSMKPVHFDKRQWENLADEFHWDGPAT